MEPDSFFFSNALEGNRFDEILKTLNDFSCPIFFNCLIERLKKPIEDNFIGFNRMLLFFLHDHEIHDTDLYKISIMVDSVLPENQYVIKSYLHGAEGFFGNETFDSLKFCFEIFLKEMSQHKQTVFQFSNQFLESCKELTKTINGDNFVTITKENCLKEISAIEYQWNNFIQKKFKDGVKEITGRDEMNNFKKMFDIYRLDNNNYKLFHHSFKHFKEKYIDPVKTGTIKPEEAFNEFLNKQRFSFDKYQVLLLAELLGLLDSRRSQKDLLKFNHQIQSQEIKFKDYIRNPQTSNAQTFRIHIEKTCEAMQNFIITGPINRYYFNPLWTCIHSIKHQLNSILLMEIETITGKEFLHQNTNLTQLENIESAYNKYCELFVKMNQYFKPLPQFENTFDSFNCAYDDISPKEISERLAQWKKINSSVDDYLTYQKTYGVCYSCRYHVAEVICPNCKKFIICERCFNDPQNSHKCPLCNMSIEHTNQ